ncbi:MAG: bifunctional adenosylcobinamide kinase/adenosylcobinamide-phosphate guanylyltransferase, partial [Candidatus Methanofishera endochildressiae]|nr:bifunctional adenosylcobinamide kinase/adenosylcobinamide-phosphate guanylyltransferase [Candidatus Methanofishera endochildressiae]
TLGIVGTTILYRRCPRVKQCQQLAHASNKQVIYIATGTVGDDEMQERISKPQSEPPR